MQVLRWTSRGSEDTWGLGEALGRLLEPGDVVTLHGEMGAGKTLLAQGIGAGLDVREPVNSPTFAIVHEYAGRVPVWHLDTYRVQSLDELIDLSWDDLVSGRGVVLIEWPERIAAALPAERLDVFLEYLDADRRKVELVATGPRMQAVLTALAPRYGSAQDGSEPNG